MTPLLWDLHWIRSGSQWRLRCWLWLKGPRGSPLFPGNTVTAAARGTPAGWCSLEKRGDCWQAKYYWPLGEDPSTLECAPPLSQIARIWWASRHAATDICVLRFTVRFESALLQQTKEVFWRWLAGQVPVWPSPCRHTLSKCHSSY